MNQFNSGPSISTYNKLSHWFDFSDPRTLKVYSGKIDNIYSQKELDIMTV